MLFYTYDIDKYRDVLRGFYIDMEKRTSWTTSFIQQMKSLNKLKTLMK